VIATGEPDVQVPVLEVPPADLEAFGFGSRDHFVVRHAATLARRCDSGGATC
jgi:hypothetical protein